MKNPRLVLRLEHFVQFGFSKTFHKRWPYKNSILLLCGIRPFLLRLWWANSNSTAILTTRILYHTIITLIVAPVYSATGD